MDQTTVPAATRREGLCELIDWWPSAAPATLEDLAGMSGAELRESLAASGVDSDVVARVALLRSQAKGIQQASDLLPPLSGPRDVLAALTEGWLRPPRKKWITYPLDKQKRRIAAPHKTRGSRYLVHVSVKVPEFEDLPETKPGGMYLLVFGDSPDVLDIGGVPQRIRRLATEVTLADVCFWHTERGEAPTLYSARAGCGDRDGDVIQFPDPDLLQEVRSAWT